jgi:hypothetical protein
VKLELSSEMAMKILEEWVYSRLRLQVDASVDLEYMEREIEEAVGAAMSSLAGPVARDRDQPPSRVVTQVLIGRAWRRIADERNGTRAVEVAS